MARARAVRFDDVMPVAAVDFSVHHSARDFAIKHAASRVYSGNLWAYGNRGMGLARAHFQRADPRDEAIGMAAAGARVRNTGRADCARTRMAASARNCAGAVPGPGSRVYSFGGQPGIAGAWSRGAASIVGKSVGGVAASRSRAGESVDSGSARIVDGGDDLSRGAATRKGRQATCPTIMSQHVADTRRRLPTSEGFILC